MPIKGLTDRNEGGFACIGMIRKGAPKGADRPGEDLHYFRVEFGEKDTETNQEFLRAFGDKPADIVVVLPFPELERCWEAWREAYLAGALIHRCDGENVQYAINAKTGEKLVVNGRSTSTGQSIKCDGAAVAYYTNKKTGKNDPVYCRPVGRLRVMIPALKRIAYLVVHTTSIHDIINISEQLRGIANLRRGNIAGIPLLLKRRPRQVSTPGEGGKRVRREKWLISIEADPKWARAQFEAMESMALPAPQMNVPNLWHDTQRPGDEGPEWPDEFFDETAGTEVEAEIGDNLAEADTHAPSEPATDTTTAPTAPIVPDEIKTIVAMVQNQGGQLHLGDGQLKLNGKDITPTLKEKVKANAKAIAEMLEAEARADRENSGGGNGHL